MIDVNHGDRGHAKNSPSSLQAKDRCPGYKGKQGPPHPITIQGTRLHENLEDELEGKPHRHDMDEEEQRLFDMNLTAVRALVPEDQYELIIEPRLTTHEDNTYGFCDILALHREWPHAVLIDHKFGFGAVTPAEHNLQGMAYALGAFLIQENPKFEDRDIPYLQTIDVVFLQPRLDWVSSHTYTRSMDLEDMLRKISEINRRVESGDELNPSPSNCEWCGNRGSCVAHQAWANNLGKLVGAPEVNLTALGTDPVAWGRARLLGEMMEEFGAQLKDASRRQASLYGQVAGYKLTQGKGKISAVNRTEIAQAALGAGIQEEDVWQHTSIKMDDLAKAVGRIKKQQEGGTIKGHSETFKELLLSTGAAKRGNDIFSLRKERGSKFLEALELTEQPKLETIT